MYSNDLNWKSWGLVIVIALGGGLELMKRMPKSESLLQGARQLRTEETEPYSTRKRVGGNAPMMLAPPKVINARPTVARPVVLPTMTKEQMEKLAASAPKTTEFDHKGDKTAEAKKKEKDDEWEIVVDPKTGKRIKRKKKKVAKKEDKKEEVVAKTEEKAPEIDEDENDNDIEGAIAGALATGRAPVSTSKKADEAFASAEEWMRKLLNRPNLAETKRFIDHKMKGLVSDEVFYKVVTAMLADPRSQMKQLGVLCLGSTPSTTSWSMLAGVVQKESSGTPAQKDAEGFVAKYKEVAKLTLMQRILQTSSNSFSTVLATKTFEASAQQYLGTQAQQTPPAGGQAAPVHNYAVNYRPFVNILKNLGKSNDQAVKNQAGITLNTLQQLLDGGSGGAQVVSPAQASN